MAHPYLGIWIPKFTPLLALAFRGKLYTTPILWEWVRVWGGNGANSQIGLNAG